MKRVSLGVIDSKLDSLTELVKEHLEADERRFGRIHDLLEGEGEHPGLKGRLDRIEQLETRRDWHVKAIWATLWSSVVAGVGSFFFGK